MMNIAVRSDDRFVTIDGLNIRYLEEGAGCRRSCCTAPHSARRPMYFAAT